VSEEVYDLDLVDDHGFVSKVNNWFRDSQRERSQPGSIASYEDECLHTVLTDCTTIELPWMFVFGCDASIVGRCAIKSESLFPTVTHKQAESHSCRGDGTLCGCALRDSGLLLTADAEQCVSTVFCKVKVSTHDMSLSC